VALLSTPAVLLRAYPYSETSQILKFFTESNGVVSAIARGVRKAGGKRGGGLSTFAEGTLNVHVRENRELQTFGDFSPWNVRRGLGKDPVRLAGASILGELILQHAESEGSPQLYAVLGLGLDAMEREDPDSVIPLLLVHLWSLVRGLGFAPLVDECVACGRPFGAEEMARFDFGAGGLRCSICPDEVQGPRLGPLARAHLKSFLEGERPPDLVRPKTHLRLASDFITYHISGGTPLRSMAILVNLIPDDDA